MGILCIFFGIAGALFVPTLGIEADEALFTQAIFTPHDELYSLSILNSRLPIMLMTYVGALKSWIYDGIFRLAHPGVLAMRLPMVAAGVASIWLFYLLLRRVAGERTAIFGCALLATDSMYLLTLTFDWGPVAMQHLLLLGGAWLLVRYYQELEPWALAGGCFLMGLAMWDKALAVWTLSGLGVATLLTLPRQLFGVLTWRRVGIAAAAFLMGALPLLVYNVENQWGTFRGNFQRDTIGLEAKARTLWLTASGPGMFTWMVAEDWQTPQPHMPKGAIQTASAAISGVAGHPRRHLLAWLFLAALAVTPLAGRKSIRVVIFALIAMAVAWLQMALNQNTGGSIHHTILLWPLPQMIVAAAFTGAAGRLGRFGLPALAALGAVAAISGVLLMNEYYAHAVRNGGGAAWNNGIYALSDFLEGDRSKTVFCMDWGMQDPLRMLQAGALPLRMGTDQVANAEMTDQDRRYATEMVTEPRNLFLAHTPQFENFPGLNERMIGFAAELGYRQEVLGRISDPFGRQVFEVYRFARK